MQTQSMSLGLSYMRGYLGERLLSLRRPSALFRLLAFAEPILGLGEPNHVQILSIVFLNYILTRVINCLRYARARSKRVGKTDCPSHFTGSFSEGLNCTGRSR